MNKVVYSIAIKKIAASMQKTAAAVNKSFRNELGNNISISIRRGKAQKPEEKNVHMVNVRLIGPTSMSENIITRMEAKEMGKALRQYLR